MSAQIIAIDAMGGDFGPRSIVQASIACLSATPSLHLTLVGQPSLLEELVSGLAAADRARLQIVAASEVVGMDERPSQALRGKPDSSMRVALELVRDGKAQACVSAGNTGALMALSRFVLKTLPGIDRPAMVAAIPTQAGYCQLLDLGANVDCSAENLYQFAVMGSVAAQALGIQRPRVALLNVGTEDIKGNQQVKLAASLLHNARGLNYIGFVEGDGLYRGEADVVVCDGFVGNILLKSSEGLASMIGARIEALFKGAVFPCSRGGGDAVAQAPAGRPGAGATQWRKLSRFAGYRHQEPWLGGRARFAECDSACADRDPGKSAAAAAWSSRRPVALGILAMKWLNVTAWSAFPSKFSDSAPRHWWGAPYPTTRS